MRTPFRKTSGPMDHSMAMHACPNICFTTNTVNIPPLSIEVEGVALGVPQGLVTPQVHVSTLDAQQVGKHVATLEAIGGVAIFEVDVGHVDVVRAEPVGAGADIPAGVIVGEGWNAYQSG